MLGVGSITYEEKIGKTYQTTSTVEQQAEKHLEKKDKLLRLKAKKEREIARIDNAMTVLNEEEYIVIYTVLIQGEKWWRLEERLHKSYRRLKYIEEDAIKKMRKYFV